MRDLHDLHHRLVDAVLAIAVVVLPFVSHFWPGRVPHAAAAVICLGFTAVVLAHATGRIDTGAAARALVLTGAGLVAGGSLLQVATSADPAATWAHEVRHVTKAMVVAVGGLYVSLGRGRGRRAAVGLGLGLVTAVLAVMEVLTALPPTGAAVLVPLLEVVATATAVGILFDVAAANAAHLARGRRSATRLAQVDALTGVDNRHGVEPAMRSVLPHHGEAALVMLDLDHFKLINDTHGHDGGDRILREVGRVLLAQTREADVVGRWGGEEFVVVLRDGGPEAALRVAERIRVGLHQIRADFPISASLGVAVVRPGDTTESLVKRADGALYRAKRAGRDRVAAAWQADAAASVAPSVIDVTDRTIEDARARAMSDLVLRDLISAARERQRQN